MMKKYTFVLLLLMFSVHGSALPASASSLYAWMERYDPAESIQNRIRVPEGYERTPVPKHFFQDWLRHLPLKPGRSVVRLYNGKDKNTQSFHVAVINIDVGTQNLQQCADAIIRFRAEYLYSKQQYDGIHFDFTSGDVASYVKWRQGYRPEVQGSRVTWRQSREADASYEEFRKYLSTVFLYAGSYSLEKELVPVKDIEKMRIGDLFIQGGFPGHAVIVVDMAQKPSTGEKVFLLAQSYMPAQDIHIVRNPSRGKASPWYALDFEEELRTPEWIFQKNQLKRFKSVE